MPEYLNYLEVSRKKTDKQCQCHGNIKFYILFYSTPNNRITYFLEFSQNVLKLFQKVNSGQYLRFTAYYSLKYDLMPHSNVLIFSYLACCKRPCYVLQADEKTRKKQPAAGRNPRGQFL